MGLVRTLAAAAVFVLDYLALLSLYTVTPGLIGWSSLMIYPVVALFAVIAIAIPILALAFLLFGPPDRSRARAAYVANTGEGYVANYPGLPMRFADYRRREVDLATRRRL